MIVERTDAAIDELLATCHDRAPIDLYPVGRRLLIEIVARALFGERLVQHTAEIDTRFARSQRYLSSPLYRQIPHPFPFTLRAGVRHDRDALDALIDTAIADSCGQPSAIVADTTVEVVERDVTIEVDVEHTSRARPPACWTWWRGNLSHVGIEPTSCSFRGGGEHPRVAVYWPPCRGARRCLNGHMVESWLLVRTELHPGPPPRDAARRSAGADVWDEIDRVTELNTVDRSVTGRCPVAAPALPVAAREMGG